MKEFDDFLTERGIVLTDPQRELANIILDALHDEGVIIHSGGALTGKTFLFKTLEEFLRDRLNLRTLTVNPHLKT